MNDERLRQEVFLLGLHLSWGYAEVMEMAVAERREYVRLLVNALEQQREAIERSGAGAGLSTR